MLQFFIHFVKRRTALLRVVRYIENMAVIQLVKNLLPACKVINQKNLNTAYLTSPILINSK